MFRDWQSDIESANELARRVLVALGLGVSLGLTFLIFKDFIFSLV